MSLVSKLSVCLAIFIYFYPFAFSQFNPQAGKNLDIKPDDVISWTILGAEYLEQENQIKARFYLETKKDFSLYTNKIKFISPEGLEATTVNGPKTSQIIDPLTGDPVDVFGSGEFDVYFPSNRNFNSALSETFKIKYIACTAVICLFPHTVSLDSVIATPTGTVDTEANKPQVETDLQNDFAEGVKSGKYSLALLFFIVFLGGVMTNLTPCVYPMIPITIRILGGQGDSAVKSSSYYALGILVTYSTLGIVAAASGQMFGGFLQSSLFNIIFALVMGLLGLSMLGFGNFATLQNIGNKLGSGKKSPFNTFMLGAGAGLVASPCTGPILGALLAYTAKSGNFVESSLLMMTYSFGFALPYVFLGGTAAKVATYKVSPKVQLFTKLFFASIMFALFFYYLRIPAYSILKILKPHWAILASVFTGAGIIAVIAWLQSPKVHHNKIIATVPAVILSFGVFSLSQWMTVSTQSTEQLKAYYTEQQGYEAAKLEQKPILVDLWAEWCEACKKMDATTFVSPEVVEYLSENYILIKLDLTEDTDENEAIQEKFEILGLPTLVLLKNGGDIDTKELIVGYQSADSLLKKLRKYNSN